MGVFPELVQSPRFALMNTAGLAADVLATVAWTSAIATFPNGNLESRWQRWLLRVSWLSLLAVPLLLLGSSTIYTSGWLDLPNGIPNPYYVDGLAWVVPWSTGLLLLPVLGILVFVFRALFGDPQTRQRLRFLGFTLLSAVVGFGLWGVAVFFRVPDSTALSVVVSVTIYISLIAIPLAFVHGVFHYGAFGVRTAGRAATALRSLSLLIGLLYCVRGRRPRDPLRPRADGGPSRGHHRRHGARPPAAALAGRGCRPAPRVRRPGPRALLAGPARSPAGADHRTRRGARRARRGHPERAPGLVDAHPPPRRNGGVVSGAARPGGRRDRATDGDPRPPARRATRRSHRGGAQAKWDLRTPRARSPRHHRRPGGDAGRECGPGRPARAASGRAVSVASPSRRGAGRRAAPHRTRPA